MGTAGEPPARDPKTARQTPGNKETPVPSRVAARESTSPSQRCLLVPRGISDEIVARARDAAPRECCGLLAGAADRVTSHFPLVNESDRSDEFLVTAGLIEPFRQMRQEKLDLVAIYHSHPRTHAWPSQKDIHRNYYPTTIHLIVSLAEAEPVLRAFLVDGRSFVEIPCRTVDPSGSTP